MHPTHGAHTLRRQFLFKTLRDEKAKTLKSIVHTCEIPILIIHFYFPFMSMSTTIQAIPWSDHLKTDIESKEEETGHL